jgi:hypothetical protein
MSRAFRDVGTTNACSDVFWVAQGFHPCDEANKKMTALAAEVSGNLRG